MLIRFIGPFLYALLIGGAWGGVFKKKFSDSLAPAFMCHIIIVLLSGMLFGRLSIGYYGGIFFAIVMAVALIIKSRHIISADVFYGYIKKSWNDGVFVFTFFYLFCFFSNSGKWFLDWDEFSHWGIFLKETLRLDSLYCTSPLSFDHKDYVPAITLFEYIMCKMNRRFAEADAYRAIQIFMFSMLLPMVGSFNAYSYEAIHRGEGKLSVIKYRLLQLSAVLFILLIPLIFNISNSFCFYHSIYCDLAVGIVFFWCIYEAYRDHENLAYGLFLLIVGVTVLVMSKMMAMALMPLVVALMAFNLFFFLKYRFRWIPLAGLIPVAGIPTVVWVWFNRFVDRYVANTGYGQSYDGMSLSSLKEVFTDPAKSSIAYLQELKNNYIDAIIHRDILIHGSYLVTMVFLIISFLVVAYMSKDKDESLKIASAGMWSLVSCIFYGLLMYFLYATAFIEFEAIKLASYERYMNSFVIAVVYFLVAIVFDSGLWKTHIRGYFAVIFFLAMDLSFLHVSAFDQVLPGVIANDEDKVINYLNTASVITDTVGEDESVYTILRGDNGNYLAHLYYYCNPRVMRGGSIGPSVDEDDIWSVDMSVDDFIDDVKKCDYIYFCWIDDGFIERYSEAFENPDALVEGSIYKISIVGSKIVLL